MDEAERLKEFLLEIHMNGGKVCPEFETCTHEACRSNVWMWQLADAALQGRTLAQMRQEKTTYDLAHQHGHEMSMTVACFKQGCGAIGVIPRPGPGELAICKACKGRDVSIIDTDRCPDGTINNCALAGGYEESMCQMCLRGPCPEAAKFRQPGTVSRYQRDPFSSDEIGLGDTSHLQKKRRR
jgi:hypothetical protein